MGKIIQHRLTEAYIAMHMQILKQSHDHEEIYSTVDTSSDTIIENSIKEYYMNGVLKREDIEHNGTNDANWNQDWNNETLYTNQW